MFTVRRTRKAPQQEVAVKLVLYSVGTAGFEPATPWTPLCDDIVAHARKVMRNRALVHLTTTRLASTFAPFHARDLHQLTPGEVRVRLTDEKIANDLHGERRD
jgi:hypothetical protein